MIARRVKGYGVDIAAVFCERFYNKVAEVVEKEDGAKTINTYFVEVVRPMWERRANSYFVSAVEREEKGLDDSVYFKNFNFIMDANAAVGDFCEGIMNGKGKALDNLMACLKLERAKFD